MKKQTNTKAKIGTEIIVTFDKEPGYETPVQEMGFLPKSQFDLTALTENQAREEFSKYMPDWKKISMATNLEQPTWYKQCNGKLFR
jgi:hypothetical protein